MNWAIHILAGILLSGTICLCIKNLRNKKSFYAISLVFIAANLMDIDHLLANPIYSPERCSINFHPFHSWQFFPAYAFGAFYKKTRFFAVGIILHLAIDWLACLI